MEQPLESEGNKIDSLLTEMTDIVKKLLRHDAAPAGADSAMMRGGSSQAGPGVNGSRLAAE